MIGFSATIDGVEQRARTDRIFSSARFGYDDGLPIAVGRSIAGISGVKMTTVAFYIPGYVREPKNHAYISMADAAMVRVFPDWQVSQAVWNRIQHDRTGIVMESRLQAERWHKKAGDTFTMIAPTVTRADGATSWTFKVLAVCDDVALAPDGFIFGNYDYYDKSRPLADQGRINEVDIVAADPAQSAAIAQQIDQMFANSANPTQTQTEKAAYAVSNNFGGMDVDLLAREIALAGLLMILFLTANVIAQSVRERFAEFATLRALGYGGGGGDRAGGAGSGGAPAWPGRGSGSRWRRGSPITCRRSCRPAGAFPCLPCPPASLRGLPQAPLCLPSPAPRRQPSG